MSVKSVFDHHAPVISKTVTIRKKVPWFDSKALELKRIRRKLERKWRSTRLHVDKLQYTNACTDYKVHLDQSKHKHINTIIYNCGSDAKKLFCVVKHLTGQPCNTILPETASDDSLAEKFAEFFLSKITAIRDELDSHDLYKPDTTCDTTFKAFCEVSQETVYKLLVSAKPVSSIADPITTKLLKESASIFTPILTRMVNLSLSTSTFATSWKEAIVKPLIKKISLDKDILNHYRPISNLSFISKLTEKAALGQLCPYIEDNNLLPSYQSAYRKFHSTETAILAVTNNILWNMENQKVTSLTAIDLSAAFDTVDHNILLSVLHNNFGIQNDALSWLESYLRQRTLAVQIRNSVSKYHDLQFSVPQGSAAGPILFTAYASTMAHVIQKFSVNISGYADDHLLYDSFSSTSPEFESHTIQNLENCLTSIRQWMNSNRLKMNDNKTEFMLCGSKAQLKKCQINNLTVGDSTIKASKSLKYLGVTIDPELHFKDHIIQKCKIASLNLRNIRALRKYLTTESCKTLVQSLVISHLDYSNTIFVDLPASTLKHAQRIQNYAAKVVLKRKKYDSATEALHDLHWLPIKQRCKFKLLVMVYKCLNNQAPAYLCELLKIQPIQGTTRSSTVPNNLVVPLTRCSTFAARSFSVAGPAYWNKLPVELRLCENIESFRKKLKTFLFNEYFEC